MAILAAPFSYALSTASTATSFTAQVPTTTEPSGAGVHNLLSPATGGVPEYLVLLPFGTNGDNDTFDFRVWGWNKTNEATPVYIPQLLVDVSVVLGNIAASLGSNSFLADTLTVNDGAADNGPWSSKIDSQEDLACSIIIHTRGCQYIKFDWDLAGAQEGVTMNCLWRPLDKVFQ
jgi:hypothetical protein